MKLDLRRLVVAIAVVGIVVLSDRAISHAQAPAATAVTAPVMIVLDASGSMNTRDAPGSRIDAAKAAVSNLIRELPATARVGLIVFGTATSSSASDQSAGCRDIRTVVPVGPVQKAPFLKAVDHVVARGYTPIGRALRQAAAALPAKQAASIVLVSDGLDTCAPPSPCDVAAKLKAANVNLVIHTVGFKVSRAARKQLSCVATGTGGTYRDATNGAELGPILHSQVDAGLRPYQVAGQPINGTVTASGAPTIAPGQYADTFPAGLAPTKYYGIDLVATETVYVTSTLIPAALRGGGTTDRLIALMRLEDPEGHRCLSTERADESVLAGKVDPVSAVLSGVVGGPKWSKRCAPSGHFVVVIARASPSTVATRAEVIVRLEAPVANAGAPPSAVPAGLTAPAVGKSIGKVGGSSFNAAAVLSTGSYRDSLSTGETRYFAVHLGWGQRLDYRIVVHRVSGLHHGVGFVRTAVATPMREEVALSANSNAARGFGGPASIDVVGSTLVPVVYANRNSSRSDVRPYSFTGNYYLTLGMSYPVGAVPYDTQVTVTVRVVGVAQAPPTYLPLPTLDRATTHASAPSAQTSSDSTANVSQSVGQGSQGSGRAVWAVLLAVVLLSIVSIFAVRRSSRKHV